jgi:hypothetical protein
MKMVTYRFIKKALKLHKAGASIKELEAKYKTGFLHKIFKFVRTTEGGLPENISETDFLIAVGKLKAEEKFYYYKQKDFKKNQTRLDKFL